MKNIHLSAIMTDVVLNCGANKDVFQRHFGWVVPITTRRNPIALKLKPFPHRQEEEEEEEEKKNRNKYN